ncbi:MAG: hypothetical protein ACNYPD_06685 [Candidatus Halichondribacter symbioticus]
MTYLKTLIALTTLALLTACGGATPTATGDSSQTTDCAANPFGASCIAEDIAGPMRLTACLADIRTNPLCTGDAGIATVFCEENPFDTRPACTAEDYADERLTACTGDITTSRCMPLVTPVCEMDFNNAVCRGIAKYDQQLRCAGGACVDFADLPTHPTAPSENDPATTDFADGFLNVKLIAPTGGKSLLNPDGTENTTINPAPFNMGGITGVTVREGAVIRRRGGRGSSDDDGFVTFRLLKANDDDNLSVGERDSLHAAILPTTNLGVPLTSTEPLTNAVWSGYYYYANADATPTDFFITFEAGLPNNQIGRIGFANPTKDGIGTGDNRPDFAKQRRVTTALAVTFDADGVLAGTITSVNFTAVATLDIVGLIGTEGVVALGNNDNVAIGFTATNPDGGAVPVVDPCIGGLAACYGTYDFWRSNARNSANNDFRRVRPAGVATIADGRASLITGDTTVLNMLDGDGITIDANYNVTLSALSDSTDTNSGYGLAFALNPLGTISNYYVGLLSGTNVGAPFTNTNQPAAEWSGLVSLYVSTIHQYSNIPITLAVSFNDADGGSIGYAEDTYTYFTAQQDENSDALRRFRIDGKFDANGVIYGGATYRYFSQSLADHETTLSGLIGVNGAVAVFGGVSVGDDIIYAGGFVARPKPASDN